MSKLYEVESVERKDHMIIKCCGEHVDVALDTIVDECEVAPVIEKIEGDKLSTGCEYCQNQAIYIVSN